MLLTQDSECPTGFLKILWEHENQTQISRLLKVAIFGIFDCFFLTLKTPWQTVTDGKKSSQNEISKEHFDTKKTEFGAKLCNK